MSGNSSSANSSMWARASRLVLTFLLPGLLILLIASVALSLLFPDDDTPMAGFVAPNEVLERASVAYRQGGFADVERLTRSFALAGDPRAQTLLGRAYQFRDDRRADACEATKWFDRAARQGYAPAQTRLAMNIQSGRGTRGSHRKAYVWIYAAARGGDGEAQRALGSFAAALDPATRAHIERRVTSWQPQREPATPIIRIPDIPILSAFSSLILRVQPC